MLRYESDFIYKIIPNLTESINNLANELKRYNDNQENNTITSKIVDEEVLNAYDEDND